MEQFSTQRIIWSGIFLLALVVVTALFQIRLHFDTMLALAIMLIGVVMAMSFIVGA